MHKVELKSKDEDIQHREIVDNSVVRKQNPVAMQQGTGIAEEPFFNVLTTRRNCKKKSNPSELRASLSFINLSRLVMKWLPRNFLFSLTATGNRFSF
jgi:hypothetical protein